jgi:hypothetical protein
MKSKGSQEVY